MRQQPESKIAHPEQSQTRKRKRQAIYGRATRTKSGSGDLQRNNMIKEKIPEELQRKVGSKSKRNDEYGRSTARKLDNHKKASSNIIDDKTPINPSQFLQTKLSREFVTPTGKTPSPTAEIKTEAKEAVPAQRPLPSPTAFALSMLTLTPPKGAHKPTPSPKKRRSGEVKITRMQCVTLFGVGLPSHTDGVKSLSDASAFQAAQGSDRYANDYYHNESDNDAAANNSDSGSMSSAEDELACLGNRFRSISLGEKEKINAARLRGRRGGIVSGVSQMLKERKNSSIPLSQTLFACANISPSSDDANNSPTPDWN